MLRFCLMLLALQGASCYGFADPGAATLTPRGLARGITLGQLPWEAPPGISDLALGELPAADGRSSEQLLWALPEHRGQLYQLHAVGMPTPGGEASLFGPRPSAALHQPPQLLPSLPMSQLRSELDHESLATLGPHLLAIGTESIQHNRREDLILLLEHDHKSARIVRTVSFPYALWDMRAAANEGIEAMCAAAGELVAASESTVTEPDGARYAPLGRTSAPYDAFAPYWVRLHSDNGRLSAMTCQVRGAGDALEVIAIERHYGTGRLIRFSVPLSPSKPQAGAKPIKLDSETLVDLHNWVHPLPNFEGIVRLPHGDLLLASDNHTGGAARPASLLLIPAAALGL